MTEDQRDDQTIRERDYGATIREEDLTVVEGRTITEVAGDGQAASGAGTGPSLQFTSFRGHEVQRQLASGGEADIFVVVRDGRQYVLKLYHFQKNPKADVLKKVKELSYRFPEHFIAINEYGFDDVHDRWYELQAFAPHGSLRDYINGKADRKMLRRILEETVEALGVLGKNDILHLDIKPSNILIVKDNPLDLVLSDFGIASTIDPTDSKKELSRRKGTLHYWSPEHMSAVTGREADYWAVGMIMLELLLGYHPFDGLKEGIIIRMLVTEGVAIPTAVDRDYALLLKGLLTREPKQRWGYEEVRKWLDGARDIPVHYTYTADAAEEVRQYVKAHKFHEKEYYSLDTLAAAFIEDEKAWEDAIAHVNRGYITKWLENNEDYDKGIVIDNMRDALGKDPNGMLLEIIYTFNKTLPFAFCGKAVTSENLLLFTGRTLRKEATKAEEMIADALISGQLKTQYLNYVRLTTAVPPDLNRLFESCDIALAKKSDRDDQLKQLYLFLDTLLNCKPLADQDPELARAYYRYLPDAPFKTKGGVKCRTIEEIGDAIEEESEYYQNVLTSARGSDLYEYLKERGFGESVEELERLGGNGYYPPKTRFNSLVIILQGVERLKIEDVIITAPADILYKIPAPLKEKCIEWLKDGQSKLSLWLERPMLQDSRLKYTSLQGLAHGLSLPQDEILPDYEGEDTVKSFDFSSKISQWRKFGRHNAVTIAYALLADSPFSFADTVDCVHQGAFLGNNITETVNSADEFSRAFSEIIRKERFLPELKPGSRFFEEADFWLRNYKNSSLLNILSRYFADFVRNANEVDDKKRRLGDEIVSIIIHETTNEDENTVISYNLWGEGSYEHFNCQIPGFENYWPMIRPMVESAYQRDLISRDVYAGHKRLLSAYVKEIAPNMSINLLSSLAEEQNNFESTKYLAETLIDHYLSTQNAGDYSNKGNNLDFHCQKIKPLADVLHKRRILSDEGYQRQLNHLISNLETAVKSTKKQKFKDMLSSLQPEHPLLAQQEKEERLFRERQEKERRLLEIMEKALSRQIDADKKKELAGIELKRRQFIDKKREEESGKFKKKHSLFSLWYDTLGDLYGTLFAWILILFNIALAKVVLKADNDFFTFIIGAVFTVVTLLCLRKLYFHFKGIDKVIAEVELTASERNQFEREMSDIKGKYARLCSEREAELVKDLEKMTDAELDQALRQG